MLKTEQILNAKFTPVSKGTYSADEVDSFLKTVAESYEQSLNENRELIKKISILADKIESYRNDEEAIKLSLLDAHRMAETVNKNAKDKADGLVAEADAKSKIILDGANRQSSQIIEEAREKAKEIVDNARTAVASLTERAQKETDLAISSARTKSAEIISKAEEKGNEIIGTSKQSYEFYSSELARLKGETEKFKALVSEICNNQLSLINDIPDVVVEASVVETAEELKQEVVETVAEIEIPEIDETETAVEAVEETAQEIVPEAIFTPEAAEEAEETEEAEEVIEESVQNAEEASEEKTAIEITDDEDDLFSLIDEMDFDNNFIASSIDEIVPSSSDSAVKADDLKISFEDIEKEAEERTVEIKDEDDEDDNDIFEGFGINLDEIDNDGEDEDISSLFDSLFDD